MHYYGVDIYAYHRGEMSTRRLLNLIRRLPADSQLSRDVNGEVAEWSTTDHLLAIVADRIAQLQWTYVSANSEDDVEAPKPIPRPGIEDTHSVEAASPTDMASFFASM